MAAPFVADLADPDQSMSLSRRDMLAATAGVAGFVGFALAVQPVAAATIATDASGLVADMVQVPTADGAIPAYRAMPATGGPFPVVVIIQEIFGLHEYIRDVARRFAKAGYFAIAPDLYVRQGDPTKVKEIKDIIANIVAKVPEDQTYADLDATIAFAKASGQGDTARLGVTGFCWGGRMTWLYAAHNPAIKAAVAWYGPLAAPKWSATAPTAIDAVPKLKAPVLGLYGGQDQGIPLEDVLKMRTALSGKTSDIIVYPTSAHGFHADYRPSYDPVAAADGWRRLLEWFKQHGAV